MEKIGKVESIINEEYFLFSSHKDLDPEEIVAVGQNVNFNDPKLKSILGRGSIFFQKGKFRVVSHQNKNIYMASTMYKVETFREPLMSSIFENTTVKKERKVASSNFEGLETSKELGISFNKKVTEGDEVYI